MLTGKVLGDAIKRAIDLKIDSGAARSKAEIARHFGVKPPSIHDWIRRGVIGKDKLPELFRYFSDVVGPDHWGIQSDDWLDHDHTAPTPNTEPGPPIRARVPLISWTTAGNWGEVVDNFTPGDAEDWIVTTANVGPHAFALRIRGDSMAPTIADGALVVVDPDTQYRHRSVVIVRQNHDSEATCKRLIQEGSRWHLAPDNQRYPIMEMSPDAKIVGVVRQVVVDLE